MLLLGLVRFLNFVGGQFGDLTHKAIMQAVARGVGGNVGEGFGFATEPGVAALMNVAGNQQVHDREGHGAAQREGHGGPNSNPPCGRVALRVKFL